MRFASYDSVDLHIVSRLAEEQSVVGLVAAGLAHVKDVKLPKEDVLQLVGQMLQLELRNSARNCFLGFIVDKLRQADIYTHMVNGQELHCTMSGQSGDEQVILFLGESNSLVPLMAFLC